VNPADNKAIEKRLQDIQVKQANTMPDMSSLRMKAEDIVRIVHHRGVTLFHDQYNEAYIAFDGNGSNVSKISSKTTKSWLQYIIFRRYTKALSPHMTNQVLQTLTGQAIFDGQQYHLSVRNVHTDGCLWYDLGKSAICITNEGWKIVEQPPILFKRFSHHKPPVVPQRGGDIRRLLKYINLADGLEQLLFLVYVVSAFIPNFPHPILILHGQQGAGKTTPMKMMKELIDPSVLNGTSEPTAKEAFVQDASHHSFLFYDNLSKMPEWFSDCLARASTGDSFSKRELYTDDEDIIYSFQKVIALNGINQVVYKSDLLDRAILLNLERISPEKRKEAQIFWAEFEQDKPYILGAIFDVLVKALAAYPAVKLSKLPRMADFTRWGYAIAQACGYDGADFVKAYPRNVEIQHDAAIDANPVAQTIAEFSKDQEQWSGTPAEFVAQLNDLAFHLKVGTSSGWPKDAARLGRILNPISPNLQAKGIKIDRPARSKDRLITITKFTVDTVVTDENYTVNNSPDN